MIAFRDATAARLGLNLNVHINEEGLEQGVNPIASGSAQHTHVMKTLALKQALDRHGIDAAIGGARLTKRRCDAFGSGHSAAVPYLGALSPTPAPSRTSSSSYTPAAFRNGKGGLSIMTVRRRWNERRRRNTFDVRG
jgi:hypothetical protein